MKMRKKKFHNARIRLNLWASCLAIIFISHDESKQWVNPKHVFFPLKERVGMQLAAADASRTSPLCLKCQTTSQKIKSFNVKYYFNVKNNSLICVKMTKNNPFMGFWWLQRKDIIYPLSNNNRNSRSITSLELKMTISMVGILWLRG